MTAHLPAAPFAAVAAYGGPSRFGRFVDGAHGHGRALNFNVVYNQLGPLDPELLQFGGASAKVA
jgi:1,4-alpha-glucan branching enzyme